MGWVMVVAGGNWEDFVRDIGGVIGFNFLSSVSGHVSEEATTDIVDCAAA